MSDNMPTEIWAFKLEESYKVLDPISYTTTIRTDVVNGFYDTKERESTKYIRADLHEQLKADISKLESVKAERDQSLAEKKALTEALEQIMMDLSNDTMVLPLSDEGHGIGCCIEAWNNGLAALEQTLDACFLGTES